MTTLAARELPPVWRGWLGGLLLCILLGACAQPPRPSANQRLSDVWTGRLALAVEGNAAQSFSAGFALEGTPEQGELTLSTPLGTVLAVLRWEPGRAELQSPGGERAANSLDELLNDAVGSAIPVAALFAWLKGDAVTATGWQADLSGLEGGRLMAVRTEPLPHATLRIALDR